MAQSGYALALVQQLLGRGESRRQDRQAELSFLAPASGGTYYLRVRPTSAGARVSVTAAIE